MIGNALRAYAAQHQLTTTAGLVYGNCCGCYVTVQQSAQQTAMSLYIGAVEAVPPGSTEAPPTARRARAVADAILSANGGENPFRLLAVPDESPVDVVQNGSVVCVRFAPGDGGVEGLNRFTAECLPQLAPMTAPMQCIHCGGHTNGQGVPVRIARGLVVPMHQACHADCESRYKAAEKGDGKLLPGVIGAAVGGIIGAVVWALAYSSGLMAVAVVLLTSILSTAGYRLLHGRPGRAQAIAVACSVFLSVVLGMLLSCLWTLHLQYLDYGSVVNGMMRESVFLRVALGQLFADGAFVREMLVDLVIGLVFAGIACAGSLFSRQKADATLRPKTLPGQA